MSNIFWLGTADAVAQIANGSIDTVDGTPANNTFIVTIGGHTVSVVGDTDVATTATNLAAALEASTDPYFQAVTWTNPSAGNITGTADTAGVPFIATLTVTGGGTGTVTNISDTIANSGPNAWGTAENWSAGLVPVASDDVTLTDNSVNVCWDLGQSAVDLASLTITKTYTGKIGLDRTEFATSSNGNTTDASEIEYRDTYLAIESTKVDIGETTGPGSPAGSRRIKLDLNVHESTVVIHGTATQSSEQGLPAIRLLANLSTTDIFVKSAQAGIGIAVDAPGETSTVRLVSISDVSTNSKVSISKGVTITTWEQTGGANSLNAAADVTTVTMKGGILDTTGDYTITTVNTTGGTMNSNHIKSGGNCITTLNINGGIFNTQNNNQTRTIATTNLAKGGTLISDTDDVIFTTFNEPSGKFTLIAS